MVEKIGEMLVKEGLITQAELEEALKSQVIYGGKLGTNLIEMGIINEEEFGKVLGRMLKVPYHSAAELRDIPQSVIASLPAELAEKYRVVPLRLESRRLTLVMANPSDLRTIDEISFRTGLLIRPVISSEMGLLHALEKYYHIPREVRYISLNRSIPVKKATASQNASSAAAPLANSATGSPAAGAANAPNPQAASPAVISAAPVAVPTATPAVAPHPVQPQSAPAASHPAPPKQTPASSDRVPVLTASIVDVAPEPAPIDIFAELSSPLETVPITLETVAQRLVAAEDREDIAEAAIGWLGEQFQRSALFLVRGDVATGWHAVSERKIVKDFDRLRIPLAEPSALKTVADTRSPVLGPLQRSLYNSMLLQELGGVIPKTVLLLPLLMLGRITAILYLDGPDSLLQEKMPELQKLTAKMIMAFEILMLRNKIMSL